MSVNHSATLKADRMQLFCDRVDSKTPAASTGSALAGQLVIGTSALSGATGVLITYTLPTPGFTKSGAVATLQGVPLTAVASAGGTAAKAEIRNNAGTVVTDGLTVGTSGTDVIISSTAITSGRSYDVTAGTITHG